MPPAAGPVFNAESFSALVPLEAEVELSAAFAGVPFEFALCALPVGAAGAAAAFDAPARVSVRMLSAWGMLIPEPIAVESLAAEDAAAASTLEGAEDAERSGGTCEGAGDSGTPGSGLGKGEMPTAPSAPAGTARTRGYRRRRGSLRTALYPLGGSGGGRG